MVKEEWKKIKGFERYEVSNHGRIRSLARKNYQMFDMKLCTHYKGYRTVYLYREGDKKDVKCFIHRLVAEAFIENPENLPIVNHKDLGKGNNYIENLEWIDESGNMMHWRNLRKEELAVDADQF